MATRERSRPSVAATAPRVSERGPAGPDPAWRGFYRVGGISAILYGLLGLVVPTLMVLLSGYDFELEGAAYLAFVAEHRTWWVVLQTLVLGSSVLAIVGFAALYPALKHLGRSWAALGALLAVVCHVLFLAYYPVLLGIAYLSDRYAAAADAERAALAAAADALVAVNGAFNPLYEPLFAVAILIVSLPMLRGVFPRSVAWLGVATALAAFVAVPLWPVVGIGYFWWWLPFLLWFTAVGWRLYRLGGARAVDAARRGRAAVRRA